MTKDDAQVIVDKVLEDLKLNTQNFASYKLYNQWELVCTTDFNKTQGHYLENLIKEVYPFLIPYANNEGALKVNIIKTIINDFPEFCPNDLFEAIKQIQ
ncbi:MAG: hypothetical protein LUG96_09650 [Tannerellaceae bacterium]|nr:hypothetical protein [Tannerellaceae bacterium]